MPVITACFCWCWPRPCWCVVLLAVQRGIGVVPVAAARAARPARQRDDPREGADARARALRGLGVLRQADARAPRGVVAAAEPRRCAAFALAQNAISLGQLRARCWLRFSPWAVLILGSPRSAGVRRRDEVLGRRVSPVPLARARDAACRSISSRARARGPRQRGQAVRARPAAARRYREIFRALYGEDRGSRCAAAPGASARPARHAAFYGAYAWIALAAVAGAITLGEMTMYLLLFKQGQAARRRRCLARSAACTRTTSTCRTSTSTSSSRSPAPHGHATRGTEPERRHPLRGRRLHLSRRDEPALRDVTLTLRPGESSRWSARTAPARPR